MKRKATFDKSIPNYEISVTYVKRERPNIQNKVPVSHLASPIPLSKETAKSLRTLQNTNPIQFLFFLDAQGKEYVDDIAELCSPFKSQMVFVTLDMGPDTADSVVDYVGTDTCKNLSKELGLLDPLGGGSYPLNYLVVIRDNHVLCMVPVRIGRRYLGGHQRFGTCLAEVPGILEEYLNYYLLGGDSVVIVGESLEDFMMKG